MRARQRLRLGLLTVVAAVSAGLGVVAYATPVLRRPELSTVDARFSVRGAESTPRDVAVVGIDDRTMADLGIRPPLPRSYHARAIQRLRAAGARVVAYDLEFSAPTSPPEDRALARAIPDVVLAATAVRNGKPLLAVPVPRGAVGYPGFPPRTARGGVIRRVTYSELGLPTLSVAAAERAGVRVDPKRMTGDGAWIDFRGPPGTVPTYPLSRLLGGRVPADRLRGRVVVVGNTAPILQDHHPTSAGGGDMSGPEIQANAIWSALHGFPLSGAAGWLAVLAVVAMGLVAPVGRAALGGLRWLAVALVAAAAYAVAAQLAFDGGTIVPVLPAALALAAGLLGTLAVTYATETRVRRRLRTAFGRFVPDAVVEELVARADDDLRLGGTRRDGTVLFCDLRGFTAVAESLPAERVIELLNRYLTEMSDTILDHGGTVVSYMGDGIMAVFGAPLEQPDHADRALAAARDMLGPCLERFNAWVREAGAPEGFRMGVGLCSGPVMSGNVGSARRLEYTAVGDTTNSAARLEAMTKELGPALLVAEATRERLAAVPEDLVEVGELPVRGRRGKVRVWTLRDGPDARGADSKAGPARSGDRADA